MPVFTKEKTSEELHSSPAGRGEEDMAHGTRDWSASILQSLAAASLPPQLSHTNEEPSFLGEFPCVLRIPFSKG